MAPMVYCSCGALAGWSKGSGVCLCCLGVWGLASDCLLAAADCAWRGAMTFGEARFGALR